MGSVRASVEVPALASAAEALWYDHSRWPSFVDGLKHVDRVQGDWPRVGARVVWDSHHGGRGRVLETVEAYEPRAGQTLAVEDERIRGTQRVSFHPRDAGATVVLELAYELKDRRPFLALVDLLFVRRPQRESLERTLRRFRAELRSDAETVL